MSVDSFVVNNQSKEWEFHPSAFIYVQSVISAEAPRVCAGPILMANLHKGICCM